METGRAVVTASVDPQGPTVCCVNSMGTMLYIVPRCNVGVVARKVTLTQTALLLSVSTVGRWDTVVASAFPQGCQGVSALVRKPARLLLALLLPVQLLLQARLRLLPLGLARLWLLPLLLAHPLVLLGSLELALWLMS